MLPNGCIYNIFSVNHDIYFIFDAFVQYMLYAESTVSKTLWSRYSTQNIIYKYYIILMQRE